MNISMESIRIGAIIRKHRKYKNYTQEQLAELINVTAGFLGQIERDESYPSFETLVRLVYVLDIDPKLLFFPTNKEHISKDIDSQLLINEITIHISSLDKKNNEVIFFLAKRLYELQTNNNS